MRSLRIGESFTIVGELFDVSELIVHIICRNFVKARLVNGHNCLQWPQGEAMSEYKLYDSKAFTEFGNVVEQLIAPTYISIYRLEDRAYIGK